jgi:hypothetical protein
VVALNQMIPERKNPLAHREGRTRSLQMPASKSLTLYPIELGGQYRVDLEFVFYYWGWAILVMRDTVSRHFVVRHSSN